MQRQSRQGSAGGHRSVRYRTAGGVLLVAHLVFVGWFALRPLDVPWVSAANLRPFAGIRFDLSLGWPEATLRLGTGLALMAPLGVLLPLTAGRLHVSRLGSLVRTTAAGGLLALLVELLQTGVPGQVVDIDSVLLAAVGVALTHLLFVPATRARLRRRGGGGAPAATQEEVPQGSTPTISRVAMSPWTDASPVSRP